MRMKWSIYYFAPSIGRLTCSSAVTDTPDEAIDLVLAYGTGRIVHAIEPFTEMIKWRSQWFPKAKGINDIPVEDRVRFYESRIAAILSQKVQVYATDYPAVDVTPVAKKKEKPRTVIVQDWAEKLTPSEREDMAERAIKAMRELCK